MSDDPNIPLLHDLIQKGEVQDHNDNPLHNSFNENDNFIIEDDDELNDPHIEATEKASSTPVKDDLTDNVSIQELLIDEEIRMILDKHMDNAYEEIIRLLSHKISG